MTDINTKTVLKEGDAQPTIEVEDAEKVAQELKNGKPVVVADSDDLDNVLDQLL